MRKIICFLLILALVLGLGISAMAKPASDPIITTATGYDSADDVVYVTYAQSGKTVIANWGARGEECVFLSTYAESYYTNDYVWDTMSQLSGGTTQSNAPSSELFAQLQDLMEGTHTFYTYYDGSKNVRDFYRYTDCVSSDITQVGLIYRGGLVSSQWDSGKTWNQEHCWPKSKLNSDEQIGDIMHLRPANPSENSSRGNKSYGESSGYYDPGVSVRGDCARMVLYMYVRYGVTGTMWGSNGVIESVDILLKWMEEDPVDTWEMGRNDSVQSVTGVRNVFVDYPEYAWLLFGQEVPENMVTPSGNDQGGDPTPCTHSKTELRGAVEATCGDEGYTGDTHCASCGQKLSSGTVIPATGKHTLDENGLCTGCDYYEIPKDCPHANTKVRDRKAATCGADGYSGDTYCKDCGQMIQKGSVVPATGEHSMVEGVVVPGGGMMQFYCEICGYEELITLPPCDHNDTQRMESQEATCVTDGYTGDLVCMECGRVVEESVVIPATGEHTLDETGHCTGCEYAECLHQNVIHRNQKEATCGAEGHTGDVYCADCDAFIAGGSVIPATGEHNYNDAGSCTVCGETQTPENQEPQPAEPKKNDNILWIIIGAVVVVAAGGIVVFKKKK